MKNHKKNNTNYVRYFSQSADKYTKIITELSITQNIGVTQFNGNSSMIGPKKHDFGLKMKPRKSYVFCLSKVCHDFRK